MSFPHPLKSEGLKEHAAPQGLDRREVGWSLARLPPFLAFLHLLSGPQIQIPCTPGLSVHPAAQELLPILDTAARRAKNLTGALRSRVSVPPGIRRQRGVRDFADLTVIDMAPQGM
jgi:hypothetical protein